MRWVGGTVLLIERGMHGATGNIYVGLHEFEEMAFTTHFLRPRDLMVDVGANVGTYSVLAAGVAGADVIACEPIPSTFARLQAIVAANGLESRTRLLQVAVGAEHGRLRMSQSADAMNRVLPRDVCDADSLEVEATTLDDVVGERSAALIKVDVEGHEAALVRGADAALGRAGAVLIESADPSVWRALMGKGLLPCSYDPWTRSVTRLDGPQANRRGNGLFVREPALAQERCRAAPVLLVKGLRV